MIVSSFDRCKVQCDILTEFDQSQNKTTQLHKMTSFKLITLTFLIVIAKSSHLMINGNFAQHKPEFPPVWYSQTNIMLVIAGEYKHRWKRMLYAVKLSASEPKLMRKFYLTQGRYRLSFKWGSCDKQNFATSRDPQGLGKSFVAAASTGIGSHSRIGIVKIFWNHKQIGQISNAEHQTARMKIQLYAVNSRNRSGTNILQLIFQGSTSQADILVTNFDIQKIKQEMIHNGNFIAFLPREITRQKPWDQFQSKPGSQVFFWKSETLIRLVWPFLYTQLWPHTLYAVEHSVKTPSISTKIELAPKQRCRLSLKAIIVTRKDTLAYKKKILIPTYIIVKWNGNTVHKHELISPDTQTIVVLVTGKQMSSSLEDRTNQLTVMHKNYLPKRPSLHFLTTDYSLVC